MRKILLLILLCNIGISSWAQTPTENQLRANSWRTMVGYALYGGGNITGISIMNEYNRYLTPNIKVAPNFKFSSAHKINYSTAGSSGQEPTFLSQQATIFEFGTMGYYEYLNPNKSGLELGLGLFYRNFQWVTATGSNIEYIGSNNIRLQENSIAEYTENTFGFNVSIGFIISISEIVKLNFNGIVQSDTGSNTGFGGFGGLSIKF